MAGQNNLHIARRCSAARNAHDVEAFLKGLNTTTTWNAFPAPFCDTPQPSQRLIRHHSSDGF
jgi:hypothetical protein